LCKESEWHYKTPRSSQLTSHKPLRDTTSDHVTTFFPAEWMLSLIAKEGQALSVSERVGDALKTEN